MNIQITGVKIENMHNIHSSQTYSFETSGKNFTYLYGPNGSGKSTVLQAIQLGLLGYVPGTKKTKASIFKHANNKKMKITVMLSDKDNDSQDIIIDREFAASSSQITITPDKYDLDTIIGNLELPILNFNEFLALTANKQKELLISILPSYENKIDVRTLLLQDSKYTLECDELVNEIYSKHHELKSIQDIKDLNSYLKEVKSQLDAEEKRITSTAQSLIFYDDYSGDDDPESIQARIHELMQRKDAALKFQTMKETRQKIETELAQLSYLSESFEKDKAVKDLRNSIEEILEALAEITSARDDTQTEIANLKAEHAQNEKVISSSGICPFTDELCDAISSNLASMQAQDEELMNLISTKYSAVSKLEKELADRESEVRELQLKIKNTEEKYLRRDNLIQLIEADIPEDIEDPNSLNEQLKTLTDDLAKASANQKYHELMDKIQKQRLEIKPQIDFIKSLIKRTGENGLQSSTMTKPFEELSNCMNNILESINLTEIGKPQFQLSEVANSFEFGMTRNSEFIPFQLLSSGEKCIFTLLFMISLTYISTSNLKFILIDDLFDHLDDGRFNTIVTKVEELSRQTQIIAAGVKPVSEDAKVKVIKVGEVND